MTSVDNVEFERKLNEIKEHNRLKKARQQDRIAYGIIWGATDLVALAALALGLWSNQTVAHWLGVPGWSGWLAAGVIDGVWVVSLAVVQLHRDAPWRALAAYQAAQRLVVLSALTNMGHGLIRFGLNPRGVVAGFLFALLPLALKWLIAISTNNAMGSLLKAPDAKMRIRQAGQVVASAQLDQTLARALGSEPVQVVRTTEVHQVPNHLNHPELESSPIETDIDVPEWLVQVQQERPVQPEPEPVVRNLKPVQPVSLSSRTDRVKDLARHIADRGGDLNSVSLREVSDWYGIKAKATASNLRKDAHAHYVTSARTGMYL